MRTCQSCSLKDSRCHELCTDIQIYLRNSRNYKTTYVNKEVSLSAIYESENRDKKVYPTLSDFLDNSGSFTEKFGHLFPTIEQIVSDHGTDRQKEVYNLMIHEKMSFSYIAEQLHMKVQSVHEVIYGHRGQGGLVRKIRKHLAKLPEASSLY
jgi:predicted DNA-binding protein YlxM (UPF0122 family)